MNLIREIFFSPMVVDAAGIILIVAALPMAGWSWAVNHMAGPKVKNAKEGTRKRICRSCAMVSVGGARTTGIAVSTRKSWQKFSDAKIGDGEYEQGNQTAAHECP